MVIDVRKTNGLLVPVPSLLLSFFFCIPCSFSCELGRAGFAITVSFRVDWSWTRDKGKKGRRWRTLMPIAGIYDTELDKFHRLEIWSQSVP
jgi:hypothetical protein